MNYGFIGFGNLAKSIYQGLKDQPDLQFGYHSKTNQHQEVPSFETLEELVSFADVIWLCIKPQVAEELLSQLKGIDLSGTLIVSTLAGTKIEFIESQLCQNNPVMRIMPNLAVAYGESVTAYCTNNQSSDFTQKVAGHLQLMGELVDLSEDKFDLFTALFGSGPAFLLEVIQAFKAKVSELDLPKEKEDALLIQLLKGTMVYFDKNKDKKGLTELIDAITSKKGTTEAGLVYFRENRVGELLQGVIEAAEMRSREISLGK